MQTYLDSPWFTVLAILVTILGSGRITRLIVHDSFPPIVFLIGLWDRATLRSSWNKLFHCHWCLSFWVTASVIGLFLLSLNYGPMHIAWWMVFGTLGLSYVSAMVIERDDRS